MTDAPVAPPPLAAIEGVQVRTLDAALAACADGATVLTVNQRLARFLNERHERTCVERGLAWWETPAILPWTRWLETVHDAAIAGGASDRARVPRIAAERRWQRIVDADGSLPPLLTPHRTARQARRAWALGTAWDCLPDGGDDGYLSRDQRHWRDWATSYAEWLDEERLVDDATLPGHVRGLIASGDAPVPSSVVLAGFLHPTPALVGLVETLVAAGTSVSAIGDGPVAAVRALSFPDDAAELRGVADAVWRHLDRDPHAALGIVVPDLESCRDEVLRALDERFFPTMSPTEIEAIGRPYDLSYGRSLADTAPVRTALLALELAFLGLELGGVSALLLSPYLGQAEDEARARERVDRRLREKRTVRMTLAEFARELDSKSALAKSLSRHAARLKKLSGRRRSTLVDWAERFGDCLRAFGFPGKGLSSEEHQSVGAWHGVLDDLDALDDDEPATVAEALGLLLRLAAERLFQSETPDGAVRVLGRLESHGQRFDALWLTGLDAEAWPPSASPDPFLPLEAQREAGLPEASPALRFEAAQRELEHWRTAAPAVVASCALERDGSSLSPAAALGVPTPADAATAARPVSVLREAVATERRDDGRGPENRDEAKVRGGAKLLQHQAECPFKAFVEHRLGVRAIEDFTLGLGKNVQGTLLHHALELFWSDVRSHAALVALDESALELEIATVVAAALEREEVDMAMRSLETPRLEALLREWIDECERPREPFEVVELEASREVVHAGVRLEIKIDRIDRVDGDRLLVIDYKSGRLPSQDVWKKERIVSPQLPLYALTDERIAGVAFAAVVAGKPRYQGIVDGDLGLRGVAGSGEGGCDAWRAHWSDSLETIADETRGGVAKVNPLKGTCKYCGARPVCRVDAAATALADDEMLA